MYLFIYCKFIFYIITQKEYNPQANVMIIHSTPRYHVLLWRGRVYIQRCHLRCLV